MHLRRIGRSAHLGSERQLINKGLKLGALNRSGEAIEVYDEVVRRFGDYPKPALREPLAMALVNKGFRLGVLDRGEDEIAAYSEAALRFGDSVDPAIREQVARALVSKGVKLGVLIAPKTRWPRTTRSSGGSATPRSPRFVSWSLNRS